MVGEDTVGTRSFDLLIDPRVQADGNTVADLQEQLDLNLEIRDALSRAHRLAADVVRMRNRTQNIGTGHEALRHGVAALHDSLFTRREPVSYPEPMLLDQLSYLYGMTTGADQKPGEDAYARLEYLRERITTYEERLSELQEQAEEALSDD